MKLAFHDCLPKDVAGGCDRCLNITTNAENNGFVDAIVESVGLAPIVAKLPVRTCGLTLPW